MNALIDFILFSPKRFLCFYVLLFKKEIIYVFCPLSTLVKTHYN